MSLDLMRVVIGVDASNDIVVFESGGGMCTSSSEDDSEPGKPHTMHSKTLEGLVVVLNILVE